MLGQVWSVLLEEKNAGEAKQRAGNITRDSNADERPGAMYLSTDAWM